MSNNSRLVGMWSRNVFAFDGDFDRKQERRLTKKKRKKERCNTVGANSPIS